jgi:hypothetical protein
MQANEFHHGLGSSLRLETPCLSVKRREICILNVNSDRHSNLKGLIGPGSLSKKQRVNEPANLDCLNLTNLYLPATHVIHDPHQKWSSDPRAYPDRYGPTNELVRKLIEQLGIKYKVPKYTIDKISHLASGPSDIVIVLDKPSFPFSHNLLTPQEFCWASLPLEHLYMLIPFTSDGERNIHEVTILFEHA